MNRLPGVGRADGRAVEFGFDLAGRGRPKKELASNGSGHLFLLRRETANEAGLAFWIFMLAGLTLVLSNMSTQLGLNESVAEAPQSIEGATNAIDPLKVAQQLVNETRKAWKESYKGDPSLAKQKFAQSMKKVDQDFAPVRAVIDKTSEHDQQAFALEYLEQMNALVREQIEWLESKTASEANPTWKQELQRHLKEYRAQYPKWEAELQQMKAQLR